MNRANAVVWAALLLGAFGLAVGIAALMPLTGVGGLVLTLVALGLAIRSYVRRERWEVACLRCQWRSCGIDSVELAVALMHRHVAAEHPETASGDVTGRLAAA